MQLQQADGFHLGALLSCKLATGGRRGR